MGTVRAKQREETRGVVGRSEPWDLKSWIWRSAIRKLETQNKNLETGVCEL